MAQEFEIIHFDAGKEPFIDRNGNQWVNVLFKGEANTPIKWVMRPDSVSKWGPGKTVYGRLEEPEGKNYKRFYKEQAPDGYGSAPSGQQSANQPAAKHDTDESIARAVALKAGVEFHAGKNSTPVDVIRDSAIFLAWLKQEAAPTITQSDPVEDMLQAAAKVMPSATNPKRPWENRQPQVTTEHSQEQQYDPMNDPGFDPSEIPY